MNIEIAITNLGTGNFYYRSINCLDDYLGAVKEFYQTYDNDMEIQLINFDVPHLTDSNLYDFLEVVNETEEDEEVVAFLLRWYSKQDVIKICDDWLYFVCETNSKVGAIEIYVREVMNIEIPEHLESYIDYEQFEIDYECNGYFIKELNREQYIIVQPF